jgi:hypothetical protein
MNAKSVPLPTPEDLATERLVAAVESAIVGIQERLANLAVDGQDAKWSPSDLVRLLQLRDQLWEERPCMITARWVDDPLGSRGAVQKDFCNTRDIGNNDVKPESDPWFKTHIHDLDLPSKPKK